MTFIYTLFHGMLAVLHSPLLSLALTCAFLVLNVLDGHSTYLVLRPDHYSRERNPIARWVFRKLKIPRGIIIFKTFLMSILVICIGYYAAWDAFTINIAMLIADLLFLLVVINNYRIHRKYC